MKWPRCRNWSRQSNPPSTKGEADEPLRGPGDHQQLDLRGDRQPRPVPGDPLHARGVRGRGAARGRRGCLADPHPRPDAGRDAFVRDRGLPGDHGGDQGRGRRRDHQLLDRRDRRADREAARVPPRPATRRRGSEHELDELREVLAAAQGLRLQGGVREQLRHDHPVPDRDERARDSARARVLRRRPCRQPRSLPRHGAAGAAAADLAGDGRERRDPAERAERRLHVRADSRRRGRAQQRAGDARLARPGKAARRLAQPRRQRPGRTRGQPLPARWRDGEVQRGADRQGAPDGRGRRPPRRHGGRGPRAAWSPQEGGGEGMSRPLEDVKILDLTRLLPGGFCTLLLADLGADVIKVEDTGQGDYVRWAPPYYGDEEHTPLGTRSAIYLALNRNKRSVRLDLKQEGGRQALLKLVESADVLVESFRPGVLDRLGVGYDVLSQANPALVYCPITGYGQDGPNRDRAGHDMNYLGLNGILGLTGEAGVPPIQSGAQIADLGGGGLMAAVGILAALQEARRSGQGQMVDISMTDGSLAWLAMEAGRYFGSGEVPERGDIMLSGGIICYRPYEAADGWVTCGALEPKFWAAFCRGVGREDLIEHQFEKPGSEPHRQAEAIFMTKTRDEWRVFNDEHDAMIEPILDLDEALESELVREREMVITYEQPELGEIRQLGFPIKLSGTPASVERPAPALGEHTEEVLTEAGYSLGEVRAFDQS